MQQQILKIASIANVKRQQKADVSFARRACDATE